MTKAAKVTFVTVGTIAFVALIFFLAFIYPETTRYSKPHAYFLGCETLYGSEVNKIASALMSHLSEPGNALPTLDELINMGLYTFPKDRKFEGNWPKGVHDLRVRLILGGDRHNIKDWKILVTSIGKRCIKGNIYVYHGLDDRGEWVEEYPNE